MRFTPCHKKEISRITAETNSGKSYWSERIHFYYKGWYFYLFNKGLASNHCKFQDYLILSNLIQSPMLRWQKGMFALSWPRGQRRLPWQHRKAASAEPVPPIASISWGKRGWGYKGVFAIWWVEIGRTAATTGAESTFNSELARP